MADGLRQLFFDRGYHDEDITDDYGEFWLNCFVCALSTRSHQWRLRTSFASVAQVLSRFGRKHTTGIDIVLFEDFKTMWAQLEEADGQEE